ncbi:MAG: helix-turn-helix domain-containing protein [Nocardioidaceae bacterium]
MSHERKSLVATWQRRATVHAALGDATRLAILDQLGLGDAAPGELGRSLGLASNLLAHHIGVLEAAGVVTRQRSEGDARRSYVRLAIEDADVAKLAPLPEAPDGVRRLLFVCTHNSARSQLAAAAWGNVSSIPASSAGTAPSQRVHPRAVRVAARHGLSLDKARTQHISDARRAGDLLVAVCDNAYEQLRDDPVALLHWAVPDPVAVESSAAFETAYSTIETRVARLADVLSLPTRRSRRTHVRA